MSEIEIKLIDPAARVPERAHDGDAGWDLRAIEAARLKPAERVAIGTGVSVAIPPGMAGLVLPRSGTALRSGIALVNSPGLIDSGYRGELRVILLNTDPQTEFAVEPGDRIAQLVFIDLPNVELKRVDRLPDTERGEGGFGSSGKD